MAKDVCLHILIVPPIIRPEPKADLYGAGSAPGVAAGIARVIVSEDQTHEIQPDDILVSVTTTAAWTLAFSLVKAVVTDTGGSLSHAVIVGREYGIPCVSGTMEATRKIKTGH